MEDGDDIMKIETAEQRKEREPKEDLERLKRLRPMDDDFMRGMLWDI